MLSFVTPWLFGAAVAASLAVAVLHLLSVRTPPPLMLPTARFVPDGEARAVARQPRLNDVRLLLLRIVALLCAGAALAGVRWQGVSASELQLVVADDRLRGDSAWRDSVLRSLSREDVLVDVSFLRGMERELGAAMVSATVRAAQLARTVRSLDRVALTVVAPPSTMSTAGYEAWRSQWPGRVSLMVMRPPAAVRDSGDITGDVSVEVVGAPRDDLVSAAFSRAVPGATRRVRIVRDGGDERDSSNVLRVQWPVSGVPVGWQRRAAVDTVGALVARGVVMVGPFIRSARWLADTAADTMAVVQAGSSVIAWWSDGEPAAVETVREARCERAVAISMPAGTDLLLSDGARGLRDALTAPCGAGAMPLAERGTAPDARSRTDSLAPASAFRAGGEAATVSDPWWLTPLLLALSCVMLIAEWWWRNREVTA